MIQAAATFLLSFFKVCISLSEITLMAWMSIAVSKHIWLQLYRSKVVLAMCGLRQIELWSQRPPHSASLPLITLKL